MKIRFYILLFITALASGCADKKELEDQARQDADSKARAEAAKKEMKTLPEAFKPRYNQKLDQTDSKKEPTPQPPPKTSP